MSKVVLASAGALSVAWRGATRSLVVVGLSVWGLAGAASGQTLASVLDVTVTQVGGGGGHTCALTTASGVKCWGNNSNGQLGDNSTASRLTAVDVTGLLSGVVQVALGGSHTCALTESGGVKCWGDNTYGQLGDNSTAQRLTPVDVSGLTSGVASITAGNNGFSCALTTAGAVKCWGRNSSGQLGDSSTTDRLTPVNVSGLAAGVVQISAGNASVCAVTFAGGAKCWGLNSAGQLGDNSTTSRSTPIDVTGLTAGVAQIAAGNSHTCAITAAGGAKCWGSNINGQLGDNSTTFRFTPVDVVGLSSNVTQLGLGAAHTCALIAGSAVKCWGNNLVGSVGDNSTTNRLTPVDVNGLASGVSRLAIGAGQSCALTTAGGVRCWGFNGDGQVGDNSTSNRLFPVDVVGLAAGVTRIASGVDHTCALTSARGAKCWGANDVGQLGNNSTAEQHLPVDVTGLTSGVEQIGVGQTYSCALTTAGGVKCWGSNYYGELGDNSTTQRLSPGDVSGLASGVAQISVGAAHACALTTTGGVKCWGWNGSGGVGDNSTTNRLTPVDVVGLTNGVAEIAAGGTFTCARTTAGGVKCWGDNSAGQLGDNSVTNRLTPVDVSGLTSGVTQIATGLLHTCALASTGGAKCWGYNDSGQIGDNSTTSRRTPVDVSGLTSGVAQITAGYGHSCARTAAGGAKCWGYGGTGALGSGGSASQLTPGDVSGLTSGVAKVDAGSRHTCSLTNAGGVKCWGGNTYGQIGDNSTVDRFAPVNIRAGQSVSFSPPSSVPVGTPVTLTATGNSSSRSFDTWTPSTCSVTSSGTVTASAVALCGIRVSTAAHNNFAQGSQRMALIQVLGNYTITTTASPVAGGSVACTPNPVAHGGNASCTPTANANYTFTSWSGDCTGTGTCSLTNVTSAKAVTANFTFNSYAITTVASPVAGGTATCTPNPVSHGSNAACTQTPNLGYTFTGWTGNCTGTGACSLTTVTSPKSVTANYSLNSYAVTAAANPPTGGAVICLPNPVNHGSNASCAQSPNAGYTFTGWSGDCTGTGACNLNNVTAPKAITSNYALNSYAITTAVAPVAGGTVTCTPNPVNHGSNASCSQTPGVGYTFTGWSGDCSGTGACTFSNVTAGKTVSANYALNTYAITATASPVAGGTVTCTPNQVNHGSNSSCSQTTNVGYTFTGWSGDCTGTGACNLNNVTGAQAVTANYALNTYTIATATTPVASGTVTCTPNPVSHGGAASCTQVPNAGYTFTGWSGDCSGAGACNLANVTAVKTVTASYTLNTYAVTGAATPTAGGTVTCTPSVVNHGSNASCTQTANAGYTFTGWSGDCTGNGACNLNNVTGAKTVTANYTLKTYAITVTASPVAGGAVTCTPNPVNHGGAATCTQVPNAGYTFTAWSGDCSGTAACNLANVTAAKTVTASYTLNTYAITGTASPAAGGTVTCTPNVVNHGSDASCTQSPNAGYTFTGWSGDCSGTGACSLTNVTAAQSVTANYTLNAYAITTAAVPVAGGTVTCTPNPVNHGGNASCTQTPTVGYTFTSWSGDCSGTTTCDFSNVIASKTVTANYTLNSYAISSVASPVDGGTVTCTPATVDHGSNASCTQTPNAGYVFTGWSGSCTGASTCDLTNVIAASSVTANYLHEPTLNIDGSVNTVYDAGTDGLLLMRYLLGVRGAALTAGVLGADAQRDNVLIETHIATNLLLFDVDGDGTVSALTDGLLILRRLLGLSGPALIEGARNGTRSDADIAAAIDLLRP